MSLLHPGAKASLRAHLIKIQEATAGNDVKFKPGRIVIATLTNDQFAQLNAKRAYTNRPALPSKTIEFDGRHFYKSRSTDGYSVDDMVQQIESALDDDSVVVVEKDNQKYVNLVAAAPRPDGYGNNVKDAAAFNAETRSVNSELYSVIPHGDKIKPVAGKIQT